VPLTAASKILSPCCSAAIQPAIDFLWQILLRHSYFRLGAIGMTAISGIEQACCDILQIAGGARL